MNEIRRSKAGISIIVATLLLIVIAVAASVIIFSFIQGFIASTTGQSTVPSASLIFLGGINWNKPFNKTGSSLGQTTLIIRNLGDNVTVESVALTDTQGNIRQLIDTFNATAADGSPEQVLAFQIFTVSPDSTGTLVTRNSLNPGTNFLTVDFGTGTVGTSGFSKGNFENFKIILTNGFSFNFGTRVV